MPAENLPTTPVTDEHRIKAAYERRKRSVPKDRYSFFNQGNLFIIHGREKLFLALLQRYNLVPLKSKMILEIGCGAGFWLRELIKWGATPEKVHGIDLIADRVTEAKRLCPESVKIQCGNAADLHFPDASFDLVIQSTVFTSILDPELKRQVASEMVRVLKGNGRIFWYDYHVNNPWNADVQGVKKQEIRRLFPDCDIDLRRTTLAPPLVRRLAPYSWIGCILLEKIPWFCTHYLGVIRKGGSRE